MWEARKITNNNKDLVFIGCLGKIVALKWFKDNDRCVMDGDIGSVHANLSDQELGQLARESPKGSANILRTNKLGWIRNSISSISCFLGEFCNKTVSWIWREKSDTRKCNFIKCSIFSNIDNKINQANLLLKTSSLVLLMFILHPLSIDLIIWYPKDKALK